MKGYLIRSLPLLRIGTNLYTPPSTPREMRPRRLWSIVLSIHRCNWSNDQFGRLYDKSGVAFHSSSDSPPQAGGSLRIGIEKFSGAVFLGNLFVWRKDRKLLRKAAQIIFLSISHRYEHPGRAACRQTLCAPGFGFRGFQSPTNLSRSDLLILPLRKSR